MSMWHHVRVGSYLFSGLYHTLTHLNVCIMHTRSAAAGTAYHIQHEGISHRDSCPCHRCYQRCINMESVSSHVAFVATGCQTCSQCCINMAYILDHDCIQPYNHCNQCCINIGFITDHDCMYCISLSNMQMSWILVSSPPKMHACIDVDSTLDQVCMT